MRRRLMSQVGGIKATLIQQLDTKAGDVVFANPNSEEKRFYRLDDGSDVIPDDYVPIGVVVIPASHNVYSDYACGVMSLVEMSLTNPNNGTIENEQIAWGGYSYDIPSIPTRWGICVTGSSGNIGEQVIKVSEYGALPSDRFSQENNPYDPFTFYQYSGEYAPSPYNKDGSKNEAYFQIATPSSTGNGFYDIDGRFNTSEIIKNASSQSDWTTSNEITNATSSGYYPAACCCWRFHTKGTSQGDWYLPSIGELGYFQVRANLLQSQLNIIRQYFGDIVCDIATSWYYHTSTEAHEKLMHSLRMDDGFCGSYFDKQNTFFVRAFTRISQLQKNYGEILISGGAVSDISAAGGESQVTGYTYSQTYGFGDSTTNGGVITEGAEISITSVSGDNLSTTETERTKKGESVLTVTMNGKTATKSWDVYQEANVKTTNTTGGTYSYGGVSAGSISNGWIGAGGGTGTGYAGNGSQYWYKSATINQEIYTSGSIIETVIESASDGYQSIAPSQSSYSVYSGSRGTTVGDVWTWGQTVYWYGSGGQTASGTIYVQQAANSYWLSSSAATALHTTLPAYSYPTTVSGSWTFAYSSGASDTVTNITSYSANITGNSGASNVVDFNISSDGSYLAVYTSTNLTGSKIDINVSLKTRYNNTSFETDSVTITKSS